MILEFPNDYRPIQLTEEWLIKFGFTNGQIEIPSQWHTTENLILTIVINNNSFGASLLSETMESEIEILPPKYIYSLQNLYYALTNEELTIK